MTSIDFDWVLARARAIKIHRSNLQPAVLYRYRVDDMRQCYADISKAKESLGYVPQVSLETGLRELAERAIANRWEATDLFELSPKGLSEKRLLFQTSSVCRQIDQKNVAYCQFH